MSIFSRGMLTGSEIDKQVQKGNITISPYNPTCLNPNSYNLKLHPELLIYDRGSSRTNIIPNLNETKRKYDIKEDSEFTNDTDAYFPLAEVLNTPMINSLKLNPIDMKSKNGTIKFTIPDEGYILQPGILYIGRTEERTFTDKFIPMINGRSSVGRLGISIHVCAGFGDIGFDGTWTLEIFVIEPVRIYPHVEIAQVCYFNPCGKVKNLYKGRYQKQEDATASRFYMNKE